MTCIYKQEKQTEFSFEEDCFIHGLQQCKKKHALDLQVENCSDTSPRTREVAKFHQGTWKGKTSVMQEDSMETTAKGESNPFIWIDIFQVKGKEFLKFEELYFHRKILLFPQ